MIWQNCLALQPAVSISAWRATTGTLKNPKAKWLATYYSGNRDPLARAEPPPQMDVDAFANGNPP